VGDSKNEMEKILKLNDEQYIKDNNARLEMLFKEPKEVVNASPMYKEYLGDGYSFSYQDYPVTVLFDGKDHYYPATIARLIKAKLASAAESNTPIVKSESIAI